MQYVENHKCQSSSYNTKKMNFGDICNVWSAILADSTPNVEMVSMLVINSFFFSLHAFTCVDFCMADSARLNNINLCTDFSGPVKLRNSGWCMTYYVDLALEMTYYQCLQGYLTCHQG